MAADARVPPASEGRGVRAADHGRIDAILDAAVACFDHFGIEATRMDDIAGEAGLQRPNLYRYFANRDAIVVEVILRDIRRLSLRLGAVLRFSGPARAVLLSALEVAIESLHESPFARHLRDRPEHIRTIVHLAASSDEVFASAVHASWAAIFDYAESRGELRRDIDPGAGIRWIIFVMFYCFLYPEALGGHDQVPTYLETFVVDAILERRPG
ncbi:MAG TPA: helix-turn-helix domain-containing protein [Acidimicrobiia bacterium]|nr:helix-turn-helix domain-containing protein [Acidimicrobiia bacterium]